MDGRCAKHSLELLKRALAIQEREYGAEHRVLAPTLRSLGNAYIMLGDPRHALELLKRALGIQERERDPDASVVQRQLQSIAAGGLLRWALMP